MINELLNRRGLLMGSGSAIDWESIARGMIDCTTLFSLPSSITITSTQSSNGYLFTGRKGLSGEVTIEEGTTTLGFNTFYGCEHLENVNLPSTLTTIRNDSFRNCKALTSVTLPNSVTSLGNNMFSGCTSLVSVNIPTSCSTIPSYFVQNCTSLKTLTIPSNITTLSAAALMYSGLETITIPSSVTSIGAQTFQGCISLAEVIMEGTTPPSLANANAFQGCTALAAIYVPDGAVSTYQGTSGWSTYASKIKPISQRPT